MRKSILSLLLAFIFSVSLVSILYVVSNYKGHKKNGFYRKFLYHAAVFKNIMDIRFTSCYLSGATPNHVFVSNYNYPASLLMADNSLTDSQQISLSIQDSNQNFTGAVSEEIDSPNYYIMNGIRPVIYEGQLGGAAAVNNYYCNRLFYSLCAPLLSGSFIIRVNEPALQQNILVKESISAAQPVLYAPGLIKKQQEGYFSTDGMLNYSQDLKRVLYIYHYRNDFICTDTNLNLLYSGKTIDTIRRAQVIAKMTDSGRRLTIAGPPLMVNKFSCVSGEWLFINSMLRADNDSASVFRESSVIDVYAVKDGHYRGSFYLPDCLHFKVRDILVSGKTLYALYDHYIQAYILNL